MKLVTLLPEDHRAPRKMEAVALAGQSQARGRRVKLFLENVAPIGVEGISRGCDFPVEATIGEQLMAWNVASTAIEKLAIFNGKVWASNNPHNQTAQKFISEVKGRYSRTLSGLARILGSGIPFDLDRVIEIETIHVMKNLRVLGFAHENIPAFLEAIRIEGRRGLAPGMKWLIREAVGHPTDREIETVYEPIQNEIDWLGPRVRDGPVLRSSDFEELYMARTIPRLERITAKLNTEIRACKEICLNQVIRTADFEDGYAVIGLGHLESMEQLLGLSGIRTRTIYGDYPAIE
ncbi:hypothetical protein HY988_04445 [Candidatus Micrarchaeota archaeon]|nr:hypothetical protein [Candidatus Micrarchaeota archaeon]